jgi:hypothetical protein
MKNEIRTVFSKLKTPNTWGRVDYQGESVLSIKNKRLDKFRPDELKNMGFVQRIMTKYVTGFPKREHMSNSWRDFSNT